MALKFYFLCFSAAISILVSLPAVECFDIFWYLWQFSAVSLANETSDIVNISSSIKTPTGFSTEILLQDKLLLSNQTTAVREENTTKKCIYQMKRSTQGV
ncbi:uncharacterized protein LOC128182991 isoform X2 [Crassostrea angulata]|uniref:uncharacterized protein LOC128182991 isoform X2 n=1 Tax=Magallana angulata TaxID=2784310 RepID=UPI0022B182E9|nr:uncharacterized protein LOC128182991 isoform X2 [Crassostrea angulata]